MDVNRTYQRNLSDVLGATVKLFLALPLALLVDMVIGGKWRWSHAVLNWLNRPQTSPAGEQITIFGRLTVGWLWTDDPTLDTDEIERDEREK